MKTVRRKEVIIFLASGAELRADRQAFGNLINKLKVHYMSRGFDLIPIEWEFLENDDHTQRKQDEYNQYIRQCDVFVSLFHTSAGKYTEEEFKIALKENKKRTLPMLTFVRDLAEGEKAKKSLKDFMKKYFKDYFWSSYSNNEKLHLDFTLWLDKFLLSNSTFTVKNGVITLGDVEVAEMSQQPFAANNEDFRLMFVTTQSFPARIEKLRQRTVKYPDEQEFKDELQQAQDEYNALTKKFEGYQQNLLETAKVIADKRQEKTSEKLKRAIEAFESGNMQGANTILRELAIEAEELNRNFEQNREQMHEYIDAFQLQAKTEMGDLKTTIEERITRVAEIYAKADDWATRSAYDKEKYAQLLYDYAHFLYKYGLYDKAEKILIHQITLSEEINGKKSTETAKSYNEIGLVYRRQGIYAKALEYYFKSLAIKEKVLSADHPDTAATYNNIGNVYHDQGKYKEALDYHFKVLTIREKVLGTDHPDTAETYNNIGVVYKSQGKYKEALDYHFKAMAIREKVLGTDHPDTAITYNNIGTVYKMQGKYKEALEYYFKAQAIDEKVLGTDHPETAIEYKNIGTAYYGQGKYKEALEYLNKALEIREKKLGHDHPLTKQVRDNIEAVENKRH